MFVRPTLKKSKLDLPLEETLLQLVCFNQWQIKFLFLTDPSLTLFNQLVCDVKIGRKKLSLAPGPQTGHGLARISSAQLCLLFNLVTTMCNNQTGQPHTTLQRLPVKLSTEFCMGSPVGSRTFSLLALLLILIHTTM